MRSNRHAETYLDFRIEVAIDRWNLDDRTHVLVGAEAVAAAGEPTAPWPHGRHVPRPSHSLLACELDRGGYCAYRAREAGGTLGSDPRRGDTLVIKERPPHVRRHVSCVRTLKATSAESAAVQAIQSEAFGNPAEVLKAVNRPDVGAPAAAKVAIVLEAPPIKQYDLSDNTDDWKEIR
jgi:hypothetical protein